MFEAVPINKAIRITICAIAEGAIDLKPMSTLDSELRKGPGNYR